MDDSDGVTLRIPFSDLPRSDLVVDAVYAAGPAPNVSADPLAKLLPCGNQGGFRYNGRTERPRLVVLFTTGADPDWPDVLDVARGLFMYYGDNKTPGRELHAPEGNRILRGAFAAAEARRADVPPFFVFSKVGAGRDVRFRGLAVPGDIEGTSSEELVALWRTKDGQRFQNYRATFSILDVATISRAWLKDLEEGVPDSLHAPPAWKRWRATGVAPVLTAPQVLPIRSREEQLPSTEGAVSVLDTVRGYFADDPYAFEACAVELVRMLDRNVVSCDLTRPWRDGGRDALGEYAIGPLSDPIRVEFALEAKCYGAKNGVGVREVSRLIARLRHRQFGILVTTSYVDGQAYRELREDGHPVVVLAGRDIVELLRQHGITTREAVEGWLAARFARKAAPNGAA